MWTSTLELTPRRVIPAKFLGRFWRGAYFSSFAPFQVQNLPRQSLPAANWVRVRNSLAGICGSDLHLIFVDGDFTIAPAALPASLRVYPGHEVVGEVIEVGDEVQHLHVGERVVLQHGPNCVTADAHPLCRSCAAGNYGICEYGAFHGLQAIGGGWSEEMLLHEQQLFRVSTEISDAQAVLLEPSAVAVHAVLRHLPQPGERVLIIGAGTIGLLILQALRALAPAAEVHVLARHTFQVERATRLGAAQIIYSRDSYAEIQLATGAQLYQGSWGNRMLLGGYDAIYDTAGTRQTTHDSLRWARAGATVVMVGLNLHRMQLDLTPVWYQEINLIGSKGHGTETWPLGTTGRKSTFEITAALIERGELHPEKLITHSYPLNDYRNALLTATDKAHNHAIKVIFDYSKQPPSVVPNVRASSRQRQRPLTSALDPRLSQPLNPRNVEEYQETAEQRKMPVSSVSMPSSDHPTAMADDESQTIVVSPSKHAHFGRTSPKTQNQAPTAPNTNTGEDAQTQGISLSKPARFDVTPHYGSLPGFHQGLDKLGITENAGVEDETTKTFAVSPPPSLPVAAIESAVDEAATDTPINAIEYFEVQENDPLSYFESVDLQLLEQNTLAKADKAPQLDEASLAFPEYTDTGEDYTWTQFIEPANSAQQPQEAQAHTENQMVPPGNISERDVEAEAGVQPEPAPAASQSISKEQSPDTVIISPAKHARSKRKTGRF